MPFHDTCLSMSDLQFASDWRSAEEPRKIPPMSASYPTNDPAVVVPLNVFEKLGKNFNEIVGADSAQGFLISGSDRPLRKLSKGAQRRFDHLGVIGGGDAEQFRIAAKQFLSAIRSGGRRAAWTQRAAATITEKVGGPQALKDAGKSIAFSPQQVAGAANAMDKFLKSYDKLEKQSKSYRRNVRVLIGLGVLALAACGGGLAVAAVAGTSLAMAAGVVGAVTAVAGLYSGARVSYLTLKGRPEARQQLTNDFRAVGVELSTLNQAVSLGRNQARGLQTGDELGVGAGRTAETGFAVEEAELSAADEAEFGPAETFPPAGGDADFSRRPSGLPQYAPKGLGASRSSLEIGPAL